MTRSIVPELRIGERVTLIHERAGVIVPNVNPGLPSRKESPMFTTPTEKV